MTIAYEMWLEAGCPDASGGKGKTADDRWKEYQLSVMDRIYREQVGLVIRCKCIIIWQILKHPT